MTEFPILDKQNAPEASVPLLQATGQAFGMVPNLEGVMAAAPPLLKGYGTLWQLFGKTSFNAIEQQIVYQTINVEHGCTY